MRWMVAIVLLALTAPAGAQELPKPTEAGQRALDDLIGRCIATGGLKTSRGWLGLGTVRLTVADAARLKAAVGADKAALTPALRDALVARWATVSVDQGPAVVALLRAIGEVADDSRALAFAAFFEARPEQTREPASSVRLYSEAAQRFAAAAEWDWQAACLNHMAFVHHGRGEYARALEGFHKALEIRRAVHGEHHPTVAKCYNNIGVVYDSQGEYARALESFHKALEIWRAMHGERHPDVAASYNNIAAVYDRQGEYAKALEGYRRALEIWRAVQGERHPDVATCYNNIGVALDNLGEPVRALESFRKALDINRAVYGERHPDVAMCYNNIAGVYDSQGEYARALEGYQKALDINRAVQGERHPDVATCYNNIALAYERQGEYARALEDYRKALEIRRAVYGERHPDVAIGHNNIAGTYAGLGDYTRALESYRKALEIWRAVHGERHPDIATCYNNIAFVYSRQGEYPRALEGYRKALEIRRAVYGERHPDIAIGHANIASIFIRQREWTRALGALDQALDALRIAADPPPASDEPRSGLGLRPLSMTVTVLQMHGQVREQSLGPDPIVGLRACLRDYQATADLLDQVRQRVLATDPSKLLLGEQAADLFPRTIGVAARLAEAERTTAGRLAAFAAAERGAARVFLESLGRAGPKSSATSAATREPRRPPC